MWGRPVKVAFFEIVVCVFCYRKHERKGIARRVSTFSSEGESISPDASVGVPTEQTYNPTPAFPVQVDPVPGSSYHEFSNPVVSISVAEALRCQSPVVVQPTPSFSHSSWNGTNEHLESVNPPTMASSVVSHLSSSPVVNPIVALSLHPPIHPAPRPIPTSPRMNQMWTGPSFTGLPREMKSVGPQTVPPVTRNRKGIADSPPIVVHLKDRGTNAQAAFVLDFITWDVCSPLTLKGLTTI